jgi:hypothetical protein
MKNNLEETFLSYDIIKIYETLGIYDIPKYLGKEKYENCDKNIPNSILQFCYVDFGNTKFNSRWFSLEEIDFCGHFLYNDKKNFKFMVENEGILYF